MTLVVDAHQGFELSEAAHTVGNPRIRRSTASRSTTNGWRSSMTMSTSGARRPHRGGCHGARLPGSPRGCRRPGRQRSTSRPHQSPVRSIAPQSTPAAVASSYRTRPEAVVPEPEPPKTTRRSDRNFRGSDRSGEKWSFRGAPDGSSRGRAERQRDRR